MTAAPAQGARAGWLAPWLPVLATIAYLARVRVQRRYVGSAVGALWSLANPIATTAILFVVFSLFMRVPIANFGLYLVAGAIPWGFLSGSLMTASSSLSGRRDVLHSSPLPPAVFVFADVTAELIIFLIAYVTLLGLASLVFAPPGAYILLLPLVLLPLVVFVYAAALAAAFLSVRFRDVPHLLQILLAMMFWLVPIVYAPDMVPEAYRPFIVYNPLALLIHSPVVLVHGGELPAPRALIGACLSALAMVLIALAVHRGLRRNIVYDL